MDNKTQSILDELFNMWEIELDEMSDVSELYDTLINLYKE